MQIKSAITLCTVVYIHTCSYPSSTLFLPPPRPPSWWRRQMETFSALLAICAGNSPVPGEFPAHRPVTRSFDVFFDLRLNKRWSKQSWGWWFETLSCSLWRHCNDDIINEFTIVCMASVPTGQYLFARLCFTADGACYKPYNYKLTH